jgi:hypothetical protein
LIKIQRIFVLARTQASQFLTKYLPEYITQLKITISLLISFYGAEGDTKRSGPVHHLDDPTLNRFLGKLSQSLRPLFPNGRIRSILLASASLPRSLRERRDIITGLFYFFGQDYLKEC